MFRIAGRLMIFGVLGLQACSWVRVDPMTITSISGVLLPTDVGSLSESKLFSEACSDPSVALCRIEDSESCFEAALGITTPDAEGRFEFRTSVLGESAATLGTRISHVIRVRGCDNDYSRPLTGSDLQDILPSTGLLTIAVQNAHVADDVFVYPKDVDALVQQMRIRVSKLNMGLAFRDLMGDSELVSRFREAFESDPEEIGFSIPRITQIDASTSPISELVAAPLSVTAVHWNPDYRLAYVWKHRGQVISTGPTATFTPSANQQGVQTLTVLVGAEDPASPGTLDPARPFREKSFPVTVSNTVLPQAPALVLVTPNPAQPSDPIGTRSLVVGIDTGAGQTHCASFVSLALVEGSLLPPPANAFQLSCQTSGLQLTSHTLTGAGDGLKRLSLWARDSSGTVSATPSVLQVLLDTQAPSSTLLVAPAAQVTSSSASFSFESSDLTPLTFECRLDSALEEDFATCSSPHNVSALAAGMHTFEVRATDLAGNVGTPAVTSWNIDINAPTLSMTTVPQAFSPLADATFVFSAADTGGAGVALVECQLDAGSWAECTSPHTISSLNEGSHTLSVRAHDHASNTSLLATHTWVVDTVAPLITLVEPTGMKPLQTTVVEFLLDDRNLTGGDPIAVEVFNGTVWSAACEASSVLGLNEARLYSCSFTSPSPTTTARVRVSGAEDRAGNVALAQTSAEFMIEGDAPAISLFEVAGGSTVTALPSVTIRLEAADSGCKQVGCFSAGLTFLVESYERHKNAACLGQRRFGQHECCCDPKHPARFWQSSDGLGAQSGRQEPLRVDQCCPHRVGVRWSQWA